MHLRTLVAALGIALGACSHVVHPARVMPGFSADLIAAPTIRRSEDTRDPPTFSPENHKGVAVQLDLRYGWAFPSGRGIQVEAMLPGSLAVYGQLVSRPDIGLGLLVGPNPGAYGMIGNSWLDADGRGYHLAAGGKLGVLPPIKREGPNPNGAVFATAAYSSGAIRAGLMAEHLEFARTWSLCDENCEPENYYRRSSSIGLFVNRSFE